MKTYEIEKKKWGVIAAQVEERQGEVGNDTIKRCKETDRLADRQMNPDNVQEGTVSDKEQIERSEMALYCTDFASTI